MLFVKREQHSTSRCRTVSRIRTHMHGRQQQKRESRRRLVAKIAQAPGGPEGRSASHNFGESDW